MIDITALLQQCIPEVAPSTMQRIISIESSYHPNVIGYKITKNGKVFTLTKQPQSREEAVSMASWFFNNGYRFDAGIAQVNSQNFERYGLTPETVFDPCTNVQVGGKILTEFYQSAAKKYGDGQKALLAAVSAYNSGNFQTGFSNGYVARFSKGLLSFPKGDYTSVWNQPPITLVSPNVLAETSELPPKSETQLKVENKKLAEEELNPYTASVGVEEFHNFKSKSAGIASFND